MRHLTFLKSALKCFHSKIAKILMPLHIDWDQRSVDRRVRDLSASCPCPRSGSFSCPRPCPRCDNFLWPRPRVRDSKFGDVCVRVHVRGVTICAVRVRVRVRLCYELHVFRRIF